MIKFIYLLTFLTFSLSTALAGTCTIKRVDEETKKVEEVIFMTLETSFDSFGRSFINRSTITVDEGFEIEIDSAEDGDFNFDSVRVALLKHRGGNGKVIESQRYIYMKPQLDREIDLDTIVVGFNPLKDENQFGSLSESFSYQNSEGVRKIIYLNCFMP